MKKALVVSLALSLIVGALALPAEGKKKPAPVATALYLHGSQPAGEAELPDTAVSSAWMAMDSTKPTDAAPKSMFVTNYLGGPNTKCSGNGLLPTWRGPLAGTVTGNVTLTLHTVASPAAQLKAELFPDGTGGCESAFGSTGYVPPAASAIVDVPPGPGTTEITFKHVKFKSVASLVLMLSIPTTTVGPATPGEPVQVRVLYDGSGFESGLKLSCVPASGATCTP